MGFIPVNNAVQVQFQLEDDEGDIEQWGIWVQRDEAWTLTAINTLAGVLAGWWATGDGAGHDPKQYTVTSMSLIALYLRDMTTVSGLSLVYNTGLPLAGLDAATKLNDGLSFALTLRTGLAGRSFRGRIFIPGLSQANLTTVGKNELNAGALTQFTEAYGSLIGTIAGSDAAHNELVVCSRYTLPVVAGKSTPRAAGLTTPVSSIGYSKPVLDFQRRRAIDHSRHH